MGMPSRTTSRTTITDKGGKGKTTKIVTKTTNKGSKAKRSRIPFDVFGNRKFVKMKYTNTGQVTSAATQNQFGSPIIYKLNAVHLPLSTQASGDLLPHNLGQYIDIYFHYRVKGVHIKVRFYDPTTESLIVGAHVNDSQDSFSLSGSVAQSLGVRRRGWVKPIVDSGSQERVYERYYDIKEIEGMTTTQFEGNVAQYEGTLQRSVASGSPAKVPTLYIACANMADSTQYVCRYVTEITYYVDLFDRIGQTPTTSTS